MGSNITNPNPQSWQHLSLLSDEELATELLAGRHDALIVLFDRYHKLIFGVALKIIRDVGEAEDLVQTVFFDAYRGLANFDPVRGTLKVWLLQYAYSRALNRQRHLAARRFYDVLELDNAGNELSSRFSTDGWELSHLVDELLAGLSPRRRTVIELTYVEGLTAAEISERLNLNPGVVRHELYRGIAKLRRALKEPGKCPEAAKPSKGKEVLSPDAQPL